MKDWFRTRKHDGLGVAEKDRPTPLLITVAILGAALVAGSAYHYLRRDQRRSRYKSRSRKPQISRWESEGGDVPQVEAVRPRNTRH